MSWFKPKEDDFSSYSSSQSSISETEDVNSGFWYQYAETLANGSLLFCIIDDDADECGYIVCTTSGNITVLFNEQYEYESSDVEYLENQIKKFYDAVFSS